MAAENPDAIGDYPSLSVLRGVDIPEDLVVSRRLRDMLAGISEKHPGPNPVNLIAQIPDIMAAFLSTVMGLEFQHNELRRQLDELR